MKVPESVLREAWDELKGLEPLYEHDVERALQAALEQLRVELEEPGSIRAGAVAFAQDFYPGHTCQKDPCDECFDDAARVTEAALNHVLGEAEGAAR